MTLCVTSENVLLILLMVIHMLCVSYRHFVNIFSTCKCFRDDILAEKTDEDVDNNNNISEVL